MRHRKLNKRFGRDRSQRKQLIRSLVRALVISYRIKTTLEKAREAKRAIEKLITLGKKASLADIRSINRILNDRMLTKKFIKETAPLFKDKKSGYTRIMKTGFRRGDGAAMVFLELTEKPAALEKSKKRPKKEKEKAESVSTKVQKDKPKESPQEPMPSPVQPPSEKKYRPLPEKKEEPTHPLSPEPKKRGAEEKEKQPIEQKQPPKEKPEIKKKKFFEGFKRFFQK